METNVAYMSSDPVEHWRHIKSVVRPNSIHVAMFTSTGDCYCDKKTILNISSRLNRTRSSLFIVCDLEHVSDTISHVQEVCNFDSLFRYTIMAEYCKRGSRLRMVVELGPGLMAHKSHSIVTYDNREEMEIGHRGRILDASARQETALLVGDDSFWSLIQLLKEQCRYVVTFCSDSTQAQKACARAGVTTRCKNEEERWVIVS